MPGIEDLLNEEDQAMMDRIMEAGNRSYIGAYELVRAFRNEEENFRHHHPEFELPVDPENSSNQGSAA